MITAILRDPNNRVVATASTPGNEVYLLRPGPEFPPLSELELVDPVAFADDTGELQRELERLAARLSDATAKAHVLEIAALACRCKENAGSWLLLTPFRMGPE